MEEGVEGPVRGEKPGLDEVELRDSVLLLVLPIISNPATLVHHDHVTYVSLGHIINVSQGHIINVSQGLSLMSVRVM